MVALILVVMLALGGGVSYTAEQSAPGDALYSIKTEVNENVRGALSLGAEANARWEAQLAARRLAEAEKLSAEGRLDAKTSADLSDEFKVHAENALKMASEIRAKGDAKAADEIETGVDAAITAHAGLNSALVHADAQASSAIESAIAQITSIRVKSETNADAQTKTNTADSSANASADSETNASVGTSGPSVQSAGELKLGL